MKLNVILRTRHFRADHEADVAIAHEIRAGETVEELAQRLLEGDLIGVDWIEVRKVLEPVQ